LTEICSRPQRRASNPGTISCFLHRVLPRIRLKLRQLALVLHGQNLGRVFRSRDSLHVPEIAMPIPYINAV
jgi:hypothetical protein